MDWLSIAAAAAPYVTSALSFLGGNKQNDQNWASSQAAQQFSADQYATRYQTTVKDMEAAGLSPMLAYSQGASTPPTGVSAQFQNSGAAAAQAFSQVQSSMSSAKLASAQQANIEADTANKAAQGRLLEAQAAHYSATAGQADATVKNLGAQTTFIERQAEEAAQRIAVDLPRGQALNMTVVAEEMFSRIQKLYPAQVNQILSSIAVNNSTIRKNDFETNKLGNETENVVLLGKKLIEEIKLLGYDVSAAASTDNLGRTTSQLKPLIDLLRAILGRR